MPPHRVFAITHLRNTVAHSHGHREDARVVAITHLRNTVAHSGVAFGTRFASAKIRKKVAGMLGCVPSGFGWERSAPHEHRRRRQCAELACADPASGA
jgi:hypothetical protein